MLSIFGVTGLTRHYPDNAAKIVRDDRCCFPTLSDVTDRYGHRAERLWNFIVVAKMRRSRNPTSSATSQSSSLATGSSGTNTNTVPSLLKELHGLVLQIQVLFRTLHKL